MGKITSILQQKNNPERVSIFIDGKYSFGINSKLIIDFDLYKDKELTDTEIDKIVKESFGENIKNKVISLISRRPRSESEVKDYIKKKLKEDKYDIKDIDIQDVIDKIILDLKEIDLINDLEFSKWFVRNRRTFRPRGKSLLKQELLLKGISKEIINNVLLGDDNQELSLARIIAKKKIKTLERYTIEKRKEKLIAFLGRKGFSWNIIKVVLDEEKLEDNS